MEITTEYLESMGYRNIRLLEDGTWIGIDSTLLYTHGLVVGLGEFGYDFRYCYQKYTEAVVGLYSMNKKDDIPVGPWIKKKGDLTTGEVLGPGAKGVE